MNVSCANAVAPRIVVRVIANPSGKSLHSASPRNQLFSHVSTNIGSIYDVGDLNKCANFNLHPLDRVPPLCDISPLNIFFLTVA
jgi:hypothetical protein